MIETNYPHLGVVYQFYEIYTPKFAPAIAAALMKHITPQSPPFLVEILGATKDKQAVDFLVKTIDLATAENKMLIACISALGELGGDMALAILQNLPRMRNNFSTEAQEELEIAIMNIKEEA